MSVLPRWIRVGRPGPRLGFGAVRSGRWGRGGVLRTAPTDFPVGRTGRGRRRPGQHQSSPEMGPRLPNLCCRDPLVSGTVGRDARHGPTSLARDCRSWKFATRSDHRQGVI